MYGYLAERSVGATVTTWPAICINLPSLLLFTYSLYKTYSIFHCTCIIQFIVATISIATIHVVEAAMKATLSEIMIAMLQSLNLLTSPCTDCSNK